ncbi:hypothetical protein VCUG_02642 [Vavraia culicis subsp. floridensis]|uniref:Uncharacterized protein n=1 Tax=Vavraia culicis (isolate floridensis) TaxID=948595 RepID=L2GRH4_VAVCU|nr:uncharacterized protein VCUG_02642 [Vavraia culicis subsp. floridensis]ELA45868.1 hypothetical protein VCUG_02642 [Vavraia culicis subsp. floridensis]
MEHSWMRATNTLIKCILCFKEEDNSTATDILICDGPGEVQLGNVFGNISDQTRHNLSEFKITEYDSETDSWNIFSNKEGQDAEKNAELFTCKDECIAYNPVYKYYVIHIPITKQLFVKVIGLKAYDEVKYSSKEFYDIIEHLIIFLDDNSLILRAFAQQLMDNPQLWGQLKEINQKKACSEQKASPMGRNRFEANLLNVMFTINDITYLSIADDQKRIAFISRDYNNRGRLPVYVSIRNLDSLFLRQSIIMNGYFLIKNHSKLFKKYSKSIIDHGLNVEVDFSDIFYDKRKKHGMNKKRLAQIITKILNKAIKCKFMTMCSVEKCIFWFKGIQSDVDFDVQSLIKYHIHFESCAFVKDTFLPTNLKKLWISDSVIYDCLLLPVGLEELYLENVDIVEKSKINVGKACKILVLRNINGEIDIPCITEIFHVQYCDNWTLEVRKNENNTIEKLHMVNMMFKTTEIGLCYDIKTVYMKNVSLLNGCVMILHGGMEHVNLCNFTGSVQILDISHHDPCLVRLALGTCQLKRIGEKRMLELTLSEADLIGTTKLNENISGISMDNVSIMDGLHLKLCSEVKNICFKNCIGTVYFKDWPCFEIIEFSRYSPYSVIKQVFHVVKSETKTVDRLVITDFRFDRTIRFGLEVKDIELKNVLFSQNGVLIIDEGFQKLTITRCRGMFQIPGVFTENTLTIGLHTYGNSIKISKYADGLYDITMANIALDRPLIINMNLNRAEFHNCEVSNHLSLLGRKCNNLVLTQFKNRLNLVGISSIRKLEVINLNLVTNPHLLSIPVEEFRAEDITIDQNITFCSCTKKVSLKSIYKLGNENIVITINNGCEDINIDNCYVPVNITSVVKNNTADYFIMALLGTCCHLTSCCPKGLSKLKLKNIRLGDTYRIEKDVNFLSLSHIVPYRSSRLVLNESLESLQIQNCYVDIDTSRVKKLKALTLTESSSLVYDPDTHSSMIYINILDMKISSSVTFAKSLATIILYQVELTRRSIVTINKNVSQLSIIKCSGTVDMQGVAGFNVIRCNKTNILQLRKLKSINDRYSLILESFCFENDVRLADNIETVCLQYVDILPDRKLILGQGCKCLKLSSSCVEVDFSRSANLKKVILKNMPLYLKEVFLKAPVTIDTIIIQELEIKDKIELPSNIRVVVLQRVKFYLVESSLPTESAERLACCTVLEHSIFPKSKNLSR